MLRTLACSKRSIIMALGCLLLCGVNVAAQVQAFKGAITDSMCAGPKGHAAMLKGNETPIDCTLACVKAGAKFVFYDPRNGTVYQLDDQVKPKAFAGRFVLLIGTLQGASTIHVSEIAGQLPEKVTRAKTIYIDCDSCVRNMTTANKAALESLTEWKRFTIVQDPKKADLVLLISPNPYLGDYVTRQGPDKRPVNLLVTHVDVVDPSNGVSYWSDSNPAGSWRVAGATKDLIGRFRARLEAEDGHVTRLLKLNEKPTSVSSSDSGSIK
jgi:hypothetical protein